MIICLLHHYLFSQPRIWEIHVLSLHRECNGSDTKLSPECFSVPIFAPRSMVNMENLKTLFRYGAEQMPESLAPAKSKEERSLVRRLDMFLLTFGCISQSKWREN